MVQQRNKSPVPINNDLCASNKNNVTNTSQLMQDSMYIQHNQPSNYGRGQSLLRESSGSPPRYKNHYPSPTNNSNSQQMRTKCTYEQLQNKENEELSHMWR